MLIQNSGSKEINLPDSKHINIEIGLKYLNNNHQLYQKVLKNFLTRYEHLDIFSLHEDALKNTMHTIKGLASTLGMEMLSAIAQKIEVFSSPELLEAFSNLLSKIMEALKNFFAP